MVTSKFNVHINAPKEKVWQVLWNDDTYRQWTAVFSEGSFAKTDWEEGSIIQFLNSKGNGSFSRIQKKIPNTQMTFLHLGEIKDGVEKESVWAGALENYYLSENSGGTNLGVEVDATEEFQSYFTDTFPKALEVVKQLSEKV
jgi:hypothetical protein